MSEAIGSAWSYGVGDRCECEPASGVRVAHRHQTKERVW